MLVFQMRNVDKTSTVLKQTKNSGCFIYITHLEYQHDESLLLNYKFLASNLTSIPIIQNFKITVKNISAQVVDIP